jgi:hypothetical protein
MWVRLARAPNLLPLAPPALAAKMAKIAGAKNEERASRAK